MSRKTLVRILADIVIFAAAASGCWWLIYLIGIVCVWYYKNYYELPLSALALDIMFSAPRARVHNFQYFYTLIAVVIFIIVSILKSKVRSEIWQKDF